MSIYSFIQGIGIGILVSAPLGPIGVLVIQKTLSKGRNSGFITGIGAATADSFYAVIAGFGVAIITKFLTAYQHEIRIIGGLILIGFAYYTFNSSVAKQVRSNSVGKKNYLADYLSTFILTISNPIPFVVFGISFASLGMADKQLINVLIVVFGVISGAVLWWFGLVSFVNIFRRRFKLKQLWWINKITGIVVALFAIFVLVSAFYNFV